jgi:hypothetical protein
MLGSRWFLGLLILYMLVATLCLVTEGSMLGSGQTSTLNEVVDAGWSQPWVYFTFLWSVLSWDFSFFQTGIGVWVKIPLLALSAAIVIPFAFEVFRIVKGLLPWGR